MIVKLAWRNLWRNKRRTFITMASVFFAVVLSVLTMGVKEGMYDRMIENMVGGYMGYAQIHSNGFWDDPILDNAMSVSPELEEVLKAHKEISGYTERLESFVLSVSDSGTKAALVIGIDPEKEAQFSHLSDRLIEGEYIDGDDQAVLIGSGLARYLKLGIGDTIVFLGQGYRGRTAAGKFPVKGIVKLPAPDLNKRVIYLPLAEASWSFGSEENVTSMVLFFDKPDHASKVVKHLSKEIGEDFEAMTWTEMIPEMQKMIDADRAEGWILMGILYAVITFGIFGTIVMMLAERQHEFGVLVAVGMRRGKLAGLVFMEVCFISLLGVFAGSAAGWPLLAWLHFSPVPLGKEMTEVYEEYGFEAVIQASISPSILLQQGLIVMLLSTILALYPLFKLSQLKAVEAMRS